MSHLLGLAISFGADTEAWYLMRVLFAVCTVPSMTIHHLLFISHH